MARFKKFVSIIFIILVSIFICYKLLSIVGGLYIKKTIDRVSQGRVCVKKASIKFNLHSANVRFNNVNLLIQNKLYVSTKIKTILIRVKLRPLFDRKLVCEEIIITGPNVNVTAELLLEKDSLKIKIKNAVYKDIKVAVPHEPLYIKNKVLHIEGIKLKLAEGEAELSGKLNFSSLYDVEFDSVYKTKNVDIQKLVSKFGIENLAFSGALNCEGNIRSHGKSIDEIKKNLNGSLDVILNNGYLTRQHILVRMFTLINMYDVIKLRFPKMDKEGIKYNTATVEAVIDSGIINVKSLCIDGERMRISGKGNIDLVKKSTNMIFGIKFFQIIDEVLNKIPIVGYIITGEDGNLFAFYVRLKSGKDGLKATVVPHELLEDVTIGLFQRLLKLPLKIMTPITRYIGKKKNVKNRR